MNAIDFIHMSLQQGRGWTVGLVSDMKDAPLTFPTPKGGNHPLWVMGHLTYSESHLLHDYILGTPNPIADWKELFGSGSEPVADPSQYPSLDEILIRFEEIRASTLAALDELSPADLDQPSKAPAEMKPFFGTIGQCMAVICMHFVFHGGQVADARRVLGRDFLVA